jgi:diguanylate cyclase (GGDEF)-like protein/PAS domain S-box-containing protein
VVVRRVQRVREAMDAIVSGDFSKRVPDLDRDELGDMARAFNHMAESLLASTSLLNEKQDMMTAVLRGAHDGIVIADAKGDIVMANAAAEQLLGKSSGQIYKGGLWAIFDNPELIQGWRGSLGDVAEEITYRQRPLQVYISRIRAPKNSDLGVAVLMRDITGEKQLREEVKKLHFTDVQTGLGNARYLDHAIAHFWGRVRTTGGEIGVLLLSIDTLKEVALAHGPKVADKTIKHAVQALNETLGKGATLARLTEDSIAAVLVGTQLGKAQALAAQVLQRIHAAPVDGIQAWASVGLAKCIPMSGDGQAELVDAARHALAQAIEAGGGCVRSSAGGTP